MITKQHRRLAFWLVKLKIWKLRRDLFRNIEVVPCWGTRWILRRMKLAQVLDNLHHAPCCPANHFHRSRLVFDRCICGANRPMRDGATRPPLRKIGDPKHVGRDSNSKRD